MGERSDEKPVYFFGVWEPLLGETDGELRHPEIHDVNGQRQPPDFIPSYVPWSRADLSGGLLHRRGVLDEYTGMLYWNYAHHWHVWSWWDRSARDEPGTASAFLAYQYPLLWASRGLSRCIRSFPTVSLRQAQEFELFGKIAKRMGKLGDR